MDKLEHEFHIRNMYALASDLGPRTGRHLASSVGRWGQAGGYWRRIESIGGAPLASFKNFPLTGRTRWVLFESGFMPGVHRPSSGQEVRVQNMLKKG
jgi:hypothetical protein